MGLNISISSFILVGYIGGISRESTRPPPLTAATCFKPFFELSSRFMPGVGHGGDRGFLNVYNELPIANVILTKNGKRTISWRCWRSRGLSNQPSLFFRVYRYSGIIPILIFYLLCQEKVEHGSGLGGDHGAERCFSCRRSRPNAAKRLGSRQAKRNGLCYFVL